MNMGSLFTYTSLVSSSTRVPTVQRASPHRVARTLETRVIAPYATRCGEKHTIRSVLRSGRRATRYRRVNGASRVDEGACHSPRGDDDADERRVDLVASRVSRDESRAIVTLHRMTPRDGGGETETRAHRRRFARGSRRARASSFRAHCRNRPLGDDSWLKHGIVSRVCRSNIVRGARLERCVHLGRHRARSARRTCIPSLVYVLDAFVGADVGSATTEPRSNHDKATMSISKDMRASD